MPRIGIVPCSVGEFGLHKSDDVGCIGCNNFRIPRVDEIVCAFGVLMLHMSNSEETEKRVRTFCASEVLPSNLATCEMVKSSKAY